MSRVESVLSIGVLVCRSAVGRCPSVVQHINTQTASRGRYRAVRLSVCQLVVTRAAGPMSVRPPVRPAVRPVLAGRAAAPASNRAAGNARGAARPASVHLYSSFKGGAPGRVFRRHQRYHAVRRSCWSTRRAQPQRRLLGRHAGGTAEPLGVIHLSTTTGKTLRTHRNISCQSIIWHIESLTSSICAV